MNMSLSTNRAEFQSEVDAFVQRRKRGERLIPMLSLPAIAVGAWYAGVEYIVWLFSGSWFSGGESFWTQV
jgi:hypothetical protein